MNGMWDSIENAEIYDEFVHDYELYRILNEELVRHAEVASARRVLDVACGTGETTRACLRRIASDAEVVGVDAAEAMIEVARANIGDPRARFVLGQATRLTEAVEPYFDRVLGNAAFWQFPDPDRVLAQVASLTEPGALLAFNVPLERIIGVDTEPHALQAALSRHILAETGVPLAMPTQLLDPAWLASRARAHGFAQRTATEFNYGCRQGELLELMQIPALLGPLIGDLGAVATSRMVDRVRESVNLEERVEVGWRYYVFERIV